MIQRRRATAALIVGLVLLAGCTGLGSQQAAPDRGERGDGGAAVDRQVQQPGGDDGEGGSSAATVGQRQLIRTATYRVEVDDYDTARQELTDEAESLDGFVADANRERHTTTGGNYTTGTVTYRVPDERFEGFLDRVERVGEVQDSQQSTKDVTDRIVDIEARLANLRAERDRLRTLYQNAEDTEATLEVGERLSEVQAEIERLEAERESLRQRVAMSTVTVRLEEPRPDEPTVPEDAWYDVPLAEAFLSSVNGVVIALRALAVTGAYAAPYLLVFGAPPVAAGALLVRRVRGRSDDASTTGDGPREDETE